MSVTRALLCALLAVGLHGAVAFALPVPVPNPNEEPRVELVWLGTSSATGGASLPVAPMEPKLSPAPVTAVRPKPAVVAATRSRVRKAAPVVPALSGGAADPSSAAESKTGGSGQQPEASSAGAAVPPGQPATTPAHAGSGTGSTDAPQQPPRLLLLGGSPCRGYFPAGARSDAGEVILHMQVDVRGRTGAVEVVQESPAAQGFGAVARQCASRLRFAPARSAHDEPVPGNAKLRLRFARD